MKLRALTMSILLATLVACGDSPTDAVVVGVSGTWEGEMLLNRQVYGQVRLELTQADDGSVTGSGVLHRANGDVRDLLVIDGGQEAQRRLVLTVAMQDQPRPWTYAGNVSPAQDQISGVFGESDTYWRLWLSRR